MYRTRVYLSADLAQEATFSIDVAVVARGLERELETDGSTVYETIGRWKGKRERGAVIEVISEAKIGPDALSYIRNILAVVGHESALVTEDVVSALLVEAAE